MRRWLSGPLSVLTAFLVLTAGIAAEFFLRHLSKDPLMAEPIGKGSPTIEVRGEVKPDFLWVGEAWHLDVAHSGTTALRDCRAVLDDREGPRFTLLPGEGFRLYSNHDNANAPGPVPRRLTLHTPQGDFTWTIRRRP